MTRFPAVTVIATALCFARWVRAESLYEVSGTVIDAGTSVAVPEAEVQISSVRAPDRAYSTIADRAGRFEFKNIVPDKYALSAVKTGYLQQYYREHQGFSTAIAVGPGLDCSNLRFEMKRQSLLFGRITDQDGDPVPNAQILLIRQSVANGLPTVQIVRGANSENDGRYSVNNLPGGVYFLAVQATPWYAQDAVMMKEHRQTVELQDAAKLDVAYAVTYFPGTTDDRAATGLKLSPGDRTEADLALQAVPTVHLAVRHPERSTMNAELKTENHWEVEIPAGSVSLDRGNGSFSIAPGRYRLTASWQDLRGLHAARQSLNLASDMAIDVSSQESQMAVNAEIIGTPAQLGQHVSILLRDGRTSSLLTPRPSAQNRLTWSAQEVTSATYEVVCSGSDQIYIDHLESGGATIRGRTIEVTPTRPVQLKIILGQGEGSLEGRVEQHGKVVAGAMVLLLREDFASAPSITRRDQTDSDGTFSLVNIVPGRYTLVALDASDDLRYAEPSVIQPFLKQGKLITIGPNQNYRVTAEFAEGEGIGSGK